MQVNIAICDDEKSEVNKIKELIYRFSKEMQVLLEISIYTSGRSIVDNINCKDKTFDIIFLDIDMPELTGIEVAKRIRELQQEIILIFISSHDQYVFEAIEYSPFRYIRKSRAEKELPLALKAAYSRLQKSVEEYLVIQSYEYDVKIKHSDIVYFETESRKVTIHLCNGKKYYVRKTIKELCKELNNNFVRVHSGCVVNVKYIDEFSNDNVTLDNGHRIVVSRARIKEVKKTIMIYWGNKI